MIKNRDTGISARVTRKTTTKEGESSPVYVIAPDERVPIVIIINDK
jgi:hypothetical protein